MVSAFRKWNFLAVECIHSRGWCGWSRFRGKRHILEERLKLLMQELGNAINETLSDSDRIAEAIGEIKRAGYDVFLVLEATIGFNKRDEQESGDDSIDGEVESPRTFETTGKIKLTTQDHK